MNRIQKTDKRKFIRLRAHHLVKYRLIKDGLKRPDFTLAQIQDIGAGGACLLTEESLPLNSLLEIDISFPAITTSLFALAKVVWVVTKRKGGLFEIGVQFVELDESLRKIINQHINLVYARIKLKKKGLFSRLSRGIFSKKTLLGLLFVFFYSSNIAFAQQVYFTPRESMIFSTLQQAEAREKALRDAMAEGQMKAMEKGSFQQSPVRESAQGGSIIRELTTHFHPYLILKTTEDTNVDLQPQAKSVFYYTIQPGVRVNYSGRLSSLNLDAYLARNHFTNRDRSSSYEADISLLTNFSLGRYQLSIADEYFDNRISSDDFSAQNDDVFVSYSRNTLNTALGRHFNRIGFDLAYKRLDYDYEHDNNLDLDRVEETINFEQYLRIATKTRLIFDYTYGRRENKHASLVIGNYKYNDFSLSATGVLGTRFTALASIAHRTTDYKTSNDQSDLTSKVNLGYRISERSDLTFAYTNVMRDEEGHQNNYIENTLAITGNHRLAFNPKFNLNFGYTADYYDYYKRTGHIKYNIIDFGITYIFRKWLDFSFDYQYKDSNASDVGTEYKRQMFTFKGEARF